MAEGGEDMPEIKVEEVEGTILSFLMQCYRNA